MLQGVQALPFVLGTSLFSDLVNLVPVSCCTGTPSISPASCASEVGLSPRAPSNPAPAVWPPRKAASCPGGDCAKTRGHSHGERCSKGLATRPRAP